MKSLWFSVAVLAIVIGFSFWSGQRAADQTGSWIAALEEADNDAWREEWQTADQRLRQIYADWTGAQDFLHIIVTHDELEEAEALFVGTLAVCRETDRPDLHMLLAQLIAALEHIREAQTISIKNIF